VPTLPLPPAQGWGLNKKATPPTGDGANHDPPNKFGGLNNLAINCEAKYGFLSNWVPVPPIR